MLPVIASRMGDKRPDSIGTTIQREVDEGGNVWRPTGAPENPLPEINRAHT